MNINKVVKLFEQGNVCVVGERGAGKDMLFGNVIARRGLEYISNAEYRRKNGVPIKYHPLDFKAIDCGENDYQSFMSGDIKLYTYPYPLGVDVYITDVGVYMPSQFCSELNRQYKHIPTFMALSRHLGECNVHINVQNLNRAWDKLREQSRTYITCLKCKVFKVGRQQVIIQRIRLYERYESCVSNVPPLRMPFSWKIGKNRLQAKLFELNHEISHGKVKEHTLIYLNQSDYNTHVFREMLKGGDYIDEEAFKKAFEAFKESQKQQDT